MSDEQEYNEPTENADGSPLEDLQGVEVRVVNLATGEQHAKMFPAGHPGGGHVHPYTISEIIGQTPEGSYQIEAFAIDLLGNRSATSNQKVVTIPGLPPRPPILLP